MSSTPESTSPPLTPARIRKLMRTRKLSQADVARAANITEADMSRMCARDMQPTEAQAARMLEVLEPHDESARTPIRMKVSDAA